MTVAELIEELQKLPPAAIVVYEDGSEPCDEDGEVINSDNRSDYWAAVEHVTLWERMAVSPYIAPESAICVELS